MGQVLHGSATTTYAIRAALQRSSAPLKALAAQYGLNPKTVAKWRKRGFVQDAPMGPKVVRSTVLTVEEEAAVVAFRRHTLLPLDDCLYALQATIAHLTRSSLHRCLQRHGISRLPAIEGTKPRQSFKRYAIGFFHIDIAEVRTEQGKLYLFVAIDRTSKFAFVQMHERQTIQTAAGFLQALLAAVPYTIHTVLTDNGAQFSHVVQQHQAVRSSPHPFQTLCAAHGIEHRLTRPNHPWTNGQVERMNRTLKDATVRRYHYSTHQQLQLHLDAFLNAYNFAKRLKTLNGLTPYQAIYKASLDEPQRFIRDPTRLIPGPNS
jgi:transposase InsO family protein